MSNIHITANVPPDASADEKKTLRAGAFQKGLSLASSDPGFRLRMILGEAWGKYEELVRWIGREIERDEEKAPGLWKLAFDVASDPDWLAQGLPKHVSLTLVHTQERLLQQAIATIIERQRLIEKAAAEETDADAMG